MVDVLVAKSGDAVVKVEGASLSAIQRQGFLAAVAAYEGTVAQFTAAVKAKAEAEKAEAEKDIGEGLPEVATDTEH